MNDENLKELESQKRKSKGIFIASILFVVFVLLGTILYPLLVTQPKKVFTSAINKIATLSKNDMEKEIPETFKGEFRLKTDLTSTDTNAKYVLDLLNNIDLGVTYKIDYTNKKLQVNMESDYKKKDLLHLDMIYQNEETYVYLKNIYSKFLKVPMNGLEELFSTTQNQEDYINVINGLQDALKKALKDNYFTKEKEIIQVNGKDKKVTKNSLLLNEKNLSEILDVLESELNNDSFIKSYAKISTSSEEEIEEMLHNIENESIHLENDIILSIYTEGIKNTFVGINISDEEDTFTLLKINDTSYTYILEANKTKMNGTIEAELNDNSLVLKMSIDSDEVSGTITFQFNYTYEVDIQEIDAQNVIDANNITDKEQEEILNNFQKNEGIVELAREFTKLFSPHLYDM